MQSRSPAAPVWSNEFQNVVGLFGEKVGGDFALCWTTAFPAAGCTASTRLAREMADDAGRFGWTLHAFADAVTQAHPCERARACQSSRAD